MRLIKTAGDSQVIKSSNSTPFTDEYVRVTKRQSPSVFSISSGLTDATCPFGPYENMTAGIPLARMEALHAAVAAEPHTFIKPVAFPGGVHTAPVGTVV